MFDRLGEARAEGGRVLGIGHAVPDLRVPRFLIQPEGEHPADETALSSLS